MQRFKLRSCKLKNAKQQGSVSASNGLASELAAYTLAAKMAEKPGVKCYDDAAATCALVKLPMRFAAMPVR